MKTGIIERTLGGVAAKLGIGVGQTYTVATGVGVALVLGLLGLPPVLGDDPAPVATAAPALPTDAVATPSPPTTLAPLGVAVPAPPTPEPAANAAPPTTVRFRPPPPPPARTNTPGPTSTTTTPAPRAPIPAAPSGTTSVFADVPLPGAPHGIAVGPDGTVYVSTDNAAGRGGVGPSEILAFSADGVLAGSFAVPGQTEDRTIGLTGLAVDARGRAVVADGETGRILRLDPSRQEFAELFTLPDLGPCLLTLDGPCEPGATDNVPEPRGVSIEAGGAVLVADRAQGVVWRFDGGEPEVWVSIDDRSPGDGPWGVDVSATGVMVTVTGLTSSVPPGLPALVAADAPGTPDATMTVVHTFESADAPRGVRVGRSGLAYVALAGADVVEVLGRGGERRRLDGGSVDPAFDTPTGLAVVPGALLVTNQSAAANDPDHWVIHRIAVDDGPAAR